MKQPITNPKKREPNNPVSKSGENTIPKSIITALKKGTKIPDLSKLMTRSNLSPGRVKYLVKSKPNYKAQYDARLEKYITETYLKIDNPNINRDTYVKKDELINFIDENDHFLVSKFVSDLPNRIKNRIEKGGIRAFAKNCTEEEKKYVTNHLVDRKKRNEYYKYACMLIEQGFEEWDTVIPTSLYDQIPREVRIEISRTKFGKWCLNSGMKYERIKERVKSKLKTPSNTGDPIKTNSINTTISTGPRPSLSKATNNRGKTVAAHRKDVSSKASLTSKRLKNYADAILSSFKKDRDPPITPKAFRKGIDTKILSKLIKDNKGYSFEYENKLDQILKSLKHSVSKKMKVEQGNSKSSQNKSSSNKKEWIHSHAVLISVNKRIVLEFEKKDAKSLNLFFRQHKTRLKEAIKYSKDLAGRPELKEVNFKNLRKFLAVYNLWENNMYSEIGAELEYFKWPSTAISEFQDVMNVDLADQGENLLSQFGYRVGKSKGIPGPERHRVLNQIYHLAEDDFEQGISNMGSAETCYRLRRIVRAIVYLIRLNQKRRADLSLALSDWEADLQYLKRKYYDGQCDGSWIWSSEVN